MSVIYFVIYVGWLLTGVATLVSPPNTISGELGPVLTIAWALLFIVGALVGLVTVLPGWWKWERWACHISLAGVAIYGFVVLNLHFTSPGSRLTQLGVLYFGGAAVFVVRLAMIWGRTYAPRR
jgi:hypothetical protein